MVDISVTISRCTARVTQHVYKHIHFFSLSVTPYVFTCNGPAKYMAVLASGLLSCTRKSGRGGGGGPVNGFPSNLRHKTQ